MYLRTTRPRRQPGPDAIDDPLADHDSHQERRRAETRVLSTFGRADQVDPEALRRLAQSLLRLANDDRLDLPARQFPPDVGLDDIEQVAADGGFSAASAVGEELGSGPLRREQRPPDDGDAPHAMAWRAMTATRLARPPSQWACDEHGRADEGYGPAAKALALAPLDRALDFLRRHRAALAQARFYRTAERFTAEVDLLCWATPTRDDAIDDDDDDGEGWEDQAMPARRQRRHHQEGREGHPPVVGGLALTRDGLPVRAWVWPGHTAEVTTSTHRKDDLRGWRVHRWGVVGDRGRFSAAHRPRLSRALGRAMLAVPRRQVTAVHRDVLTRAGRSRDVAPHRRVQEVYVGEGERRRRSLVGHHPDEAAREHAPRERLLALVRAELAALDTRPADHPKNAGALMASRRFGRDLRRDAHGRLSRDAAQVAAAAKDAGKCVVTTHDDTLAAAAVARGYPRMPLIEGGFRPMKTTGLQTRPRDHWRPPRLIAQVQRCVLALLRPRAAAIRGQQTWRTMRQTLDQCTVGRYQRHGKTMVHRTQVTAPMAEILHSLGMPLPQKILAVYEEVRSTPLSSIHASQTPCVSY
jgi:hypothetical protein